MTSKGATTCHTTLDCLFWTNSIPTFDCSSLEEEVIIKSFAFAGNFGRINTDSDTSIDKITSF